MMASAVAAWMTPISTKLWNYFYPVTTTALQQLDGLLGGTSQRKLFNSYAGVPTPEWQRAVLVLYAMVCSLAAVVCAILLLQRAFRYRNSRIGLLGFLCLAYPLTLAAHYLPGAASLGDRASTFLFLPLALSVALVVTRDRRLNPSDGGTYARHTARRQLHPAWATPPSFFLPLFFTWAVCSSAEVLTGISSRSLYGFGRLPADRMQTRSPQSDGPRCICHPVAG